MQESILFIVFQNFTVATERSPMDGGDDSTWGVPLSTYYRIPIQPKCLLLVKGIMWLAVLIFMWTEVQEWRVIYNTGKYAGGGITTGWGRCREDQYMGLFLWPQ